MSKQTPRTYKRAEPKVETTNDKKDNLIKQLEKQNAILEKRMAELETKIKPNRIYTKSDVIKALFKRGFREPDLADFYFDDDVIGFTTIAGDKFAVRFNEIQ
jgi:tRNA A-37 threonylcarbamoyl transferase component Bud32